MPDPDDTRPAVVIERVLDAPADLVWRLRTEPAQFAAWYGPDGAAVAVARMDVRVGVRRLVCLQMDTSGPMRMWFTGEYVEAAEHRRLVYTESLCDEHGTLLAPEDVGMPPGHPTTTEVAVDLEDLGVRTRMVLTHVGVRRTPQALQAGRSRSTSSTPMWRLGPAPSSIQRYGVPTGRCASHGLLSLPTAGPPWEATETRHDLGNFRSGPVWAGGATRRRSGHKMARRDYRVTRRPVAAIPPCGDGAVLCPDEFPAARGPRFGGQRAPVFRRS